MNGAAWFITGAVTGGFITMVIMCCMVLAKDTDLEGKQYDEFEVIGNTFDDPELMEVE